MTRCWLSETHIAITPEGKIKPCTRYKDTQHSPNINDEPIQDLFTHDYFKNIREQLKSGEFPQGCSKCESQENNQVMSMRQIFNTAANFSSLTETSDDIRSLEIAFSNHCNYRCRHCNSFSSAKWKKEDELLGRPVPDTMLLEPNIENININNIRNLEHIKILGGEPLINKTHDEFLRVVSKRDCSRISLEYFTNGSVFPSPEIIEIWKKFKCINLNVSLDDIETHFDYFRTDADFFTKVKPICSAYDDLTRVMNIKPCFHIAINVLNVYRLDKILDYIFQNYPDWNITVDTVINPEWLKIDQWSKNDADVFCNLISLRQHKTNSQHNKDTIKYICRIISSRCKNEVTDFTSLLKYNGILDESRTTKDDFKILHSVIFDHHNKETA